MKLFLVWITDTSEDDGRRSWLFKALWEREYWKQQPKGCEYVRTSIVSGPHDWKD